MKKRNLKVLGLAGLLGLSMSALALTSCSSYKDNGVLDIVTTNYSEYSWARTITKDVENVNVELLLKNKVDMHSYQPSADDLVSISNADVFIYNGGESEEWVEKALDNKSNPNRKAINLSEALSDKLKPEEEKEGMQEDDEHEESGEHEEEMDEHTWLSIKNAKLCTETIRDTLVKIDDVNSSTYLYNTQAFLNDLTHLDEAYTKLFSTSENKVILFGDRFPFRYLTEDYGLDYYAAFKGCSAESEASFETIVKLASLVDEHNLDSIYKLESSDGKIANSIKEATTSKNQTIRSLDSLQSNTAKDYDDGKDYYSVMKSNLNVLIDDFNPQYENADHLIAMVKNPNQFLTTVEPTGITLNASEIYSVRLTSQTETTLTFTIYFTDEKTTTVEMENNETNLQNGPAITKNDEGYWVINGEVSEFKGIAANEDLIFTITFTDGTTKTVEMENTTANLQSGPAIVVNENGYWTINGEVTNLKAAGFENIDSEGKVIDPNSVDIDMTKMSATMIYSTVLNMMQNPTSFKGRTIKVTGLLSAYVSKDADGNITKYYPAVFIPDATACCQQGIEFTTVQNYEFPNDFKNILNLDNGSSITVVGQLDTYVEGSYTYIHLINSEIL